MAKYVYPAIFSKEQNGQYSVAFPDLPGCYTCGNDLQDALDMANDALCLWLYDAEERQEPVCPPSDPKEIAVDQASFASLVSCDTIEYRKFYDNKSVKKTLTIPSWLNTIAERENVNFSSVLSRALQSELHLEHR